ncbi:MAG: cytochrome C assembly protein, partial [Chloroflexi bacterium]|nr:cytochrome C assembly protein [Chloroflexota bacterium]
MQPAPRALKALSWVSAILFAAALPMTLFYAPREAVMGDVQRVFYFHVASAWVGALAFLVACVAGVLLLKRGDRRWDAIGLASVEIG